MNSIIQRTCEHEPKKFKLTGSLNNSFYEFLVCDTCRNDDDFDGFNEEVIPQ